MKTIGRWSIWILIVLSVCESARCANHPDPARDTTASAIAIANLNQQIAQLRDDPGVEDLLLVRSRFLGDYEALDRATELTEHRFETGRDLLQRARTRAAVHRFADALADLAAAERDGMPED